MVQMASNGVLMVVGITYRPAFCIPRINEFEMGTNLDRFNPPDFHELKRNFPAFKYIGPPTHFPWEAVLKSSYPVLIASFVTFGAYIAELYKWWQLT